jgi:hypothetical protein
VPAHLGSRKELGWAGGLCTLSMATVHLLYLRRTVLCETTLALHFHLLCPPTPHIPL